MIAVTQHWNPLRYARNARFVAELGTPLLDLLAPQPHERILDLGCGDGALTENLRTTGATVVGVDASAEQVVAAKSRGIDARVMDGRALNFSREFDA
ncbi:MAG: methyltransferase domain-containing protein, partial [Alphaproteobacteria bacterium]